MRIGPAPTDESKLVTIKQFAAIASLGVRTLERLDQHGQLPRRVPIYGHKGKLLRKKLWSRRSVDDWIRRRGDVVKVAI